MNAPGWFLKELKAFDEDLRLRWSSRVELWQLERRVRRSLHPGTVKCDDYHDDYIRARDGFILVASVPPNGLSRSIFEKLRASDLWANGGWQKLEDDLQVAEAVAEERRRQDFSRDIRDLSKDAWNWIAQREGRQIFNAGWVQ